MEMHEIAAFLAAGGLLTTVGGALVLSRTRADSAKLAQFFALVGFILLGSSWAVHEVSMQKNFDWSPFPTAWGHQMPGLLMNRLALSMSCLVALLNFIVNRYASRYLATDGAAKGFYVWSQATIAAVLFMTLSNNFIIFWLAWLGTSLGLHQLLTLYKEKTAARRTAALKFGISRLGDVMLLGAAFLIWQEYRSFHFPTILDAAASGQVPNAIGVLIAIGALTKSALVPFHSWLPETIDTPTPVSALMHAGIINAGGYLILRTLPFVSSNPTALALLCFFGILSIVVAGLTMLSTPDVKRQLALSTTAQMGFMFVQIGFGLPFVALAHMIAHAFYKAYAFLGAFESPRLRQRQQTWTWGAQVYTIWVVGLSSLPLVLTLFMPTSLWTLREASLAALTILLVASGLSLFGAIITHKVQRILGSLLLLFAALCLLKFSHDFGSALLATPLETFRSAGGPMLVFVVFCAQALFVLQRSLPLWKGPGKHVFMTHARHGFYIHAFGQSIMRKLGYV